MTFAAAAVLRPRDRRRHPSRGGGAAPRRPALGSGDTPCPPRTPAFTQPAALAPALAGGGGLGVPSRAEAPVTLLLLLVSTAYAAPLACEEVATMARIGVPTDATLATIAAATRGPAHADCLAALPAELRDAFLARPDESSPAVPAAPAAPAPIADPLPSGVPRPDPATLRSALEGCDALSLALSLPGDGDRPVGVDRPRRGPRVRGPPGPGGGVPVHPAHRRPRPRRGDPGDRPRPRHARGLRAHGRRSHRRVAPPRHRDRRMVGPRRVGRAVGSLRARLAVARPPEPPPLRVR